MDSLNTLFEVCPFSEAMHQWILAVLLREPALMRQLGFQGTPRSTAIETNGRLFDISVSMAEGRSVHVEIKVDADFGETQLSRQRLQVQHLGHEMLYIILGDKQFLLAESRLLSDWRGVNKQQVDFNDQGEVISPYVIRENACRPKVVFLPEMMSAIARAIPNMKSVPLCEIASAYLECLKGLQARFNEFAVSPIQTWDKKSWLAFFKRLQSTRLQSGTISSIKGHVAFSFASRLLAVERIGAADFIEYYCGLVADKRGLKFYLTGSDREHDDRVESVRNELSDLLKISGESAGFPIAQGRQRLGKIMTVGAVDNANFWCGEEGVPEWKAYSRGLLSAESVLITACDQFASKNPGLCRFKH